VTELRPRLLVAGILLAAATGCGTTVPLAQQRTVGTGDALGQQPLTDPTPAYGGPSALPSSGPQPSVGLGGPGPLTGTAGPGTVPVGGPGSVPTGGSTATTASRTPVRVGVVYLQGADQAASAIGAGGLATGDAQAQAKAVFDWVNGHGGLAGRPIAPTYYGVSAAEGSSDPATAGQKACTSLTQDAHVQFVVSYLATDGATAACFVKAGVQLLNDQSGLIDTAQRVYARQFAAPGDVAPGRMLTTLVDALWRTGWLTAASKVGSYTYDTPDNNSLVDRYLVPALQAHGLQIASKQRVAPGAGGISQNSSVALQFATAHVDRVIPVLASPLLLMNAASSQGYRPRYALYSTFGPGALLETAAPKDQLAGAAGIGWQPYLDIGAGTQPGPVSRNETLCFDVLAKAGQGSTSATTKALQLNLCNVILYLKAAADRVGSVGSDLLASAGPLLGGSFAAADTFRSVMGRHPDGAGAYRDLTYQGGCSCFQYGGGLQPMAGS
jgi:hypothetical protein